MSHAAPSLPLASQTLVGSDLDRTLIYSAAALASGDPVPDPVCVERYQGREQSFLSARALAGLGELSRVLGFVPVTTRTQRQYHRITLPGVRVGHAVTSNGGVLLADGAPCPDWADTVAKRLAEVTDQAGALAELAPLLTGEWIRELRDADGYFSYLLLHPDRTPDDWAVELAERAGAIGWTSSWQGRKLYLIPRTLTKEAALAEIASRTGTTTLLTAGDSLLDRGMLLAADRAIRPRHGELDEQHWRPDGLAVTQHAGGLAADEIVAWFGVDYGVVLT